VFCETAPLFVFLAVHNGGHDRKVAIRLSENNGRSVRMTDIGVYCSEGLFRSLSFESERYGPHAYHGDDITF
jgi:cbb3-type cytochrome oxidase cytochrome c subunit